LKQISLKCNVDYCKTHKILIFNGELLCKSNLKLQKILRICVKSFVNFYPDSYFSFFVWFKVISIYQKQISTLQRQKIIRKSKVIGMEKNPDLLASIVLKKYSESKEYGTISETGDNKKENSNGRPKGKAFFACNVIVYAPVWFSGSRVTVDWEALQLPKNNETDTSLLEWLYQVYQRAKKPQLISHIDCYMSFYTA